MNIKAVVAGVITGGLFMVIFPGLLILLNDYLSLPAFTSSPVKIVGVALMGLGAAIFIYCTRLFIKLGQGTPAPIAPATKLLAVGIYRFTRNPMYLGYFAVLFGEFLFFGRILLLGYWLIIIVFIHCYVVYWEEPRLERRFGKNYNSYRSQVPRWL